MPSVTRDFHIYLILFIFVVNLKKDSENTPVKGGTMADLGKFVFVYC